MRFRLRIRQTLESILARIAFVVVPRLPRSCVVFLAKNSGTAAYFLAGHLRRVGYANLDIAFGDELSRKQKKKILRTSFQTFALTLLDLFWFSQPERVEQHVDIDPSYNKLTEKRATVCLTGHLGNWELLGQKVAGIGADLASVAAPLANERVDQLFNRARRQTGQTVISKKGAMRRLLQALKDEKPIAILLDQNTKPSKGGIFVSFFSLPVPISTAAASLLLHTHARLIFGSCVADRTGQYHTPALREIPIPMQQPEESKMQAVRRITQFIAREIETEIRKRPGQWLWMYKRWKYVAPGHNRDEYPFYAKEMLEIDRQALEKLAE